MGEAERRYFGVMQAILTDNGRQFISNEIREVMSLMFVPALQQE